MNRSRGFTLIELMIVVAIIAILAALAISQYQDYVTKAQFSESTSILDGIKANVGDFAAQYGRCPGNTSDGFLATTSYTGKYVASITLTSSAFPCYMMATFKGTGIAKPLINATVGFTATDNGGTFSWVCHSNIADKYKPAACR